MAKICPLISNFTAFPATHDKDATSMRNIFACEKEKCAWWIKIEGVANLRSAVAQGQDVNIIDEGCCAMKFLALKK